MTGSPTRRVRCAIYTRKSSEEGLEQDFNSLDAQREACAAYILSQTSEGWSALPDRYDDGGISGGTLERPALKRLMADVASGKVDVIVVYKVDRLSRSLFDFAKLVEAFEKAGTSFVSITQSFNTTSSMGRLTLNMLLSFAQFEREVTAERIRDKISASKAKGMWMGGIPPIGYRPDGRTLAIVPEHADLVKLIHRRYLEIGNVRLLQERLICDGVRVPSRTTATGKEIGGIPFSRSLLHTILKNRLYLGEIVHRDRTYPGLHKAIVDQGLFDEVQAMLAGNQRGEHPEQNARSGSPLAGKIVDAAGVPLIPAHACKGATRYSYYVSRDLHFGKSKRGLRLSASSVERPVAERIAQALAEPLDFMKEAGLQASDIEVFHDRCRAIVAGQAALRAALLSTVTRVRVGDDAVHITCDREKLASLLEVSASAREDAQIALTIKGGFRWRRGFRLVTNDGVMSDPPKDQTLVRLIVQARGWWVELRRGEITVSQLARREGLGKSYVSRVVRLAFLAPSVIDAALAGRLLAHVDTGKLKLDGFSSNWKEQERDMLPGSAWSARPSQTASIDVTSTRSSPT